METTKDTISNLILSCFQEPKFMSVSTTEDMFVIQIGKDNTNFPIRILIPLETLGHYLTAQENSKNEYKRRVEKEIRHRISKFTGQSAPWTINLHVPL